MVTDGKDYSTNKWSVTVNEAGQGFSITGAAGGIEVTSTGDVIIRLG